jgi:hypothetical protein
LLFTSEGDWIAEVLLACGCSATDPAQVSWISDETFVFCEFHSLSNQGTEVLLVVRVRLLIEWQIFTGSRLGGVIDKLDFYLSNTFSLFLRKKSYP